MPILTMPDTPGSPHDVRAVRASRRLFIAASCCALLAACVSPAKPDPAVQHRISFTWNGVAHRSVDAPLAQVRAAAISALAMYSMRVDALGVTPRGESIKAHAREQRVLIELDRQGRGKTVLHVTAERTLATDLIIEALRVLGPES
jgi:hypothetical protein